MVYGATYNAALAGATVFTVSGYSLVPTVSGLTQDCGFCTLSGNSYCGTSTST